jgi:hypothetical protein
MDDLTRTASQEFSDAAWFQWLDLVNENALPMFTMDNGNGMSVRFEYVF